MTSRPDETGPPLIFDRALLRRRRARFAPLFAGATFLHQIAAEDIAARLNAANRRFVTALVSGPATGLLGEALAATGQVGTMVALDLADGLAPASGLFVSGDEEALPFRPAMFDLVVSSLSLHAANDLPGALSQIRRVLKPDGLFLANLLGAGTLGELREAFLAAESETTGSASPRVAPFADVRDMGGLLQRTGFALPVADRDMHLVRYATPFGLMRDLRAMGVSGILADRSRRPLRRATLLRMAEIYAARFSDPDGRLRASFGIVSLSGWAPHESQPRPLRPGSARMRLSDALGVAERSAGEPAEDG